MGDCEVEMGVETALGGAALGASALGPAGLVAAGALGIAGAGYNIYESNVEANALRQQGDIVYQDYMTQANQVQLEAYHYHENQIMQYTMSGVSIQGTPMQVLDYTVQQSQLEINSIKQRAENERDLAYQKAAKTQFGGAAKAIIGLGTTALNIAGAYNTAKAGGIFDGSGQGSHVWNDSIIGGDLNVFG